MLKLRLLEIFYHVYREGSVSAAAESLNITQPSVSKMLKDSEMELEVTMFNRVKGRLIPTEEAHLLAEQLDPLFEAVEGFENAAKQLFKTGNETINVLSTNLLLEHIIAPIMGMMFHKHEIDINVSITEQMNSLIHTLISDPETLAVSYRLPLDDNLSGLKIGVIKHYYVPARELTLPNDSPAITLEHIVQTPLILPSMQSEELGLIKHLLKQQSTNLSDVFYAPSTAAMLGFWKQGGKGMIINQFQLRAWRKEIPFIQLSSHYDIPLYLIHNKSNHYHKNLVDTLVRELSKQMFDSRLNLQPT